MQAACTRGGSMRSCESDRKCGAARPAADVRKNISLGLMRPAFSRLIVVSNFAGGEGPVGQLSLRMRKPRAMEDMRTVKDEYGDQAHCTPCADYLQRA